MRMFKYKYETFLNVLWKQIFSKFNFNKSQTSPLQSVPWKIMKIKPKELLEKILEGLLLSKIRQWKQ